MSKKACAGGDKGGKKADDGGKRPNSGTQKAKPKAPPRGR